jgi:hypothetical protein
VGPHPEIIPGEPEDPPAVDEREVVALAIPLKVSDAGVPATTVAFAANTNVWPGEVDPLVVIPWRGVLPDRLRQTTQSEDTHSHSFKSRRVQELGPNAFSQDPPHLAAACTTTASDLIEYILNVLDRDQPAGKRVIECISQGLRMKDGCKVDKGSRRRSGR